MRRYCLKILWPVGGKYIKLSPVIHICSHFQNATITMKKITFYYSYEFKTIILLYSFAGIGLLGRKKYQIPNQGVGGKDP